jgi:hypothetical protein
MPVNRLDQFQASDQHGIGVFGEQELSGPWSTATSADGPITHIVEAVGV